MPSEGYEEIGTVDVGPGVYFTKLSSFQEHIRAKVCGIGGEAAVAYANGAGVYIKATVLRRAETWSSSSASTTPPPAAGAAHGCEVDTQCKGDRICVEGKCEEPRTKPEAADDSGVDGATAPGHE